MNTFRKWREAATARLYAATPKPWALCDIVVCGGAKASQVSEFISHAPTDLRIALELNAHLLQVASNAVDLIDRYFRERHPEAEHRTVDEAIEQLMTKLDAIVEKGLK